MSRAGTSPAVRVFLGVVMANALAALIWFGFGWGGTRGAATERHGEPWFAPGDFAASLSPMPAGLDWRRKQVTIRRLSRATVSEHERALGMLQLPGYTLGNRSPQEATRDLAEVLNAVDHRARYLFLEQWVPPVIRLPSGQREAALNVVLDRQGKVVRRNFVGPSGNDALDSSIVAAAARVGEILPLPQAYGDAEYELNVNFRLE
jgi:TonB family protein